jgi:serine/threonine protein kinase
MRELERFIGEVLDEKYRLDRLLGRGGMGAVYLATHLGTERPVALKIITPQLMKNDEFVERFKREARAAGRLRHPNVVDVTDFGFASVGTERVAYLVMEYLDGCTLADVLAEEQRLPLDWVVDILEQVCSAVDEAHQQGIVHRDLKPDNIWLEPNRLGGYRVKVLDFGIAKLGEPTAPAVSASANVNELAATVSSVSSDSASRLKSESAPATTQGQEERAEAATQVYTVASTEEAPTRIMMPETVSSPPNVAPAEADTLVQPTDPEEIQPTQMLDRQATKRPLHSTALTSDVTRVGAILGTPLYMSPEQCRGQRLDARSDIYSLGVIAYQMLTGQTPFAGDMLTVMRQHMESDPPPLRDKNRKVKKKVARQVMAALKKNPATRPASAAGFASALRGSAEGIGSLLRRGFALYSEHFPKFLRISLLAHIPVVVVVFLLLGFDVLEKRDVFSNPVEIAISVVLGLLNIGVGFLSTSVITAMTALMVTQLHVAPMRPLSMRDAFAVLKRRWRPFLRTSIRVSLTVMLGFAMFIIPGLVVMVRYSLYAPVVLMEGLEKRAALKRANELSRRSRRTVIALLAIQLLLPFIMGALVGFLSVKMKGGNLHIGSQSAGRIAPLFNIITVPLISITTALLYLKMRQLGGETFKETLEQFDNVEAPRRRWQERMRRRLTINTPISRG